jgi:hypothetical protein
MSEWIPFEEGHYAVEDAFLLSPDFRAIRLHDTVMEIHTDRFGKKRLSGSGLVRNASLIRLLDEHDDVDLILKLSADFRYRLIRPDLTGGKVFSPEIRSTLQFIPTQPWQEIPAETYDFLLSKLDFISKS